MNDALGALLEAQRAFGRARIYDAEAEEAIENNSPDRTYRELMLWIARAEAWEHVAELMATAEGRRMVKKGLHLAPANG